jgi:hypothetical protein
MKTFVVDSAILRPSEGLKACAEGAPKMLHEAGVRNVKLKSCYCCGPEGRIVFVADAENKDAMLEALRKINIPVASIMEAEEVAASE